MVDAIDRFRVGKRAHGGAGTRPQDGDQSRDTSRRRSRPPTVSSRKIGVAAIDERFGFHGLRRTYASLRCAASDDVALRLEAARPRKAYDRRLNGHKWAQVRSLSRR